MFRKISPDTGSAEVVDISLGGSLRGMRRIRNALDRFLEAIDAVRKLQVQSGDAIRKFKDDLDREHADLLVGMRRQVIYLCNRGKIDEATRDRFFQKILELEKRHRSRNAGQ